MQAARIGRLCICTTTLLASIAAALGADEPPTWRVSPNGNDAWSGQRAQANGHDGPLATIRAAVQASRKQRAKAKRIILAPGRYYVRETIVVDARDSGLSIEGAGAGKTIVYGGQRVIGWHRDGDRFWAADAPDVKTGEWDFRALVVNDRLCPRARLPEQGRFEHESKFPVRWMCSDGGGWERKPTKKERTTLKYRAADLGPWLSVCNAEVTVFHMWDESMVPVAGLDPTTRTLTFAAPCGHPPGAFGVKTYVVWNVREGMKRPGQWYLDRDAGKAVRFKGAISKDGWQGEWSIPLDALGIAPTTRAAISFNLGVYRSATDEWINWIGTEGPTWKLARAGTLRLGPAKAK